MSNKQKPFQIKLWCIFPKKLPTSDRCWSFTRVYKWILSSAKRISLYPHIPFF